MEKKSGDCYDALTAVFEQEIQVLRDVSSVQEAVRTAARARSWVDFETAERSLLERQALLAALDAERLSLVGEKASFARYAATLSAEKREPLLALYREIKLLAARIRFENDALAAWTAEQSALVTLFLKAAFPDFRGALYARDGRPRSADMSSVILNQKM